MPDWDWWGAFATGWIAKDMYMSGREWWSRKKIENADR